MTLRLWQEPPSPAQAEQNNKYSSDTAQHQQTFHTEDAVRHASTHFRKAPQTFRVSPSPSVAGTSPPNPKPVRPAAVADASVSA